MEEQRNVWCNPNIPIWKQGDERSVHLKEFYNAHVLIDDDEVERNCICVDVLTEYIHKYIEKQNDAFIEIGPFIKQGSSREGTKIGHTDEFDIVLLFRLKDGIKTDIVEYPSDSLATGMAKVRLLHSGNLDQNLKQIDQYGVYCLDAEYIHMAYFQKLVDKAIANAEGVKLEKLVEEQDKKTRRKYKKIMKKKGCNLKITGRVTDSPAVTLEIGVTDLDRSGYQVTVHVDIVPGFELKDRSTRRKFLVPKRQKGYRDSSLTWRISYAHFEVEVFRIYKMPKGFPRKRSRTLTSSYMIFKALKRDAIRRDAASHFCVFKTYYLKNAFMHVLYFIHKHDLHIRSISRGLAFLVFFVRIALENKCLPQFFAMTCAVRMYFPDEIPQSRAGTNLLGGKEWYTLQQIRQAIDDSLERYHMGDSWIESYMKPYKAKLRRFYETDVAN